MQFKQFLPGLNSNFAAWLLTELCQLFEFTLLQEIGVIFIKISHKRVLGTKDFFQNEQICFLTIAIAFLNLENTYT